MSDFQEQPTRSAFLWTRILNIPFWVLLNLIPIILYKDLKGSPWVLAVAIAIKPASALFASYWSVSIHRRSDRLVSNLVLANLFRYLPFLFVPWIENPWVLIGAFGFYMMLSRGAIPAWMEIFKLNLKQQNRPKLFAYGSALDYCLTALLPIGMGLILDDYSLSWRLLFPLSASLGLLSTFFLFKLPYSGRIPLGGSPFDLKQALLKPWKESYRLLQKRSDFIHFQLGFLIGGAGLMVMQPVIPIFFVDVLSLSYTKMLIAIALCKAVGYAAASPIWVRFFERCNIYSFSGSVSLLSAFFALVLITSELHSLLVYSAYLLYGVMQAGSELSWHLSGPHFAREEESSSYTTTNILLVGLRGCIAPPLGSLIFSFSSSTFVLLIGSGLCLTSALYLIRSRNLEAAPNLAQP